MMRHKRKLISENAYALKDACARFRIFQPGASAAQFCAHIGIGLSQYRSIVGGHRPGGRYFWAMMREKKII